MKSPSRILCAVDLSTVSSQALKYAIDLAEALRAELTVLHVFEAHIYALPGSAFIPSAAWTADLIGTVERKFESWVERHQVETQVKLEPKLVQGSVHQEIERMAKKMEADLLVVGTHGHKGVTRFLMGSVAERVVRVASVPVISVRTSSNQEGALGA